METSISSRQMINQRETRALETLADIASLANKLAHQLHDTPYQSSLYAIKVMALSSLLVSGDAKVESVLNRNVAGFSFFGRKLHSPLKKLGPDARTIAEQQITEL